MSPEKNSRKGRKKGYASPRKGQPDLYDEPKKRRTISLTDTGWERLEKLADSYQLSKSELIERIARNILAISANVELSPKSASLSEPLKVQQPTVTDATFEQLLEGADFEEVVPKAAIPLERLTEIASGTRPTDRELVGLSRALSCEIDKLIEIRLRLFPDCTNPEKSCYG